MTQPNDPQRQFELAAQQAREKVAREKQAQEKARQEALAKAKADEARHQARLEMFRTLFRRYQEELIRPMLVAFANAQKLRFTGPEIDVPPREPQPWATSVLTLQRVKGPAIGVQVVLRLMPTGVFSGETVKVSISAREDRGDNQLKKLWTTYVSGSGRLFEKDHSFPLADFEKRFPHLATDVWLREQLAALSAAVAEVLARSGG
jgi:hypothetical protein